MPIDYSKYPDNWKEIREGILNRADHRCEWCGVKNHTMIIRNPDNMAEFVYLSDHGQQIVLQSGAIVDSEKFSISANEDEQWIVEGWAHQKEIKVVLTIAHVHDRDPMNVDRDNLAALCQRCHLMHDAKDNAAKAARTRARKQRRQYETETGQMSLFDGE